MGVQYPDGLAKDSPRFLPPVLAPGLTLPQVTGDDLSWVATNATRARGVQPITNVNPDGDYAGTPLMAVRGQE